MPTQEKRKYVTDKEIDSMLQELDERLTLLSQRVTSMAEGIDTLVRFSMTTKAFMELAIGAGLFSPEELQHVASGYESGYDETLKAGLRKSLGID